MAAVKPFRCIHPANGREEQIAALPYDVYSREEARNAVEGKPLSFLNIDRPETCLPRTGYVCARSLQSCSKSSAADEDRGQLCTGRDAGLLSL